MGWKDSLRGAAELNSGTGIVKKVEKQLKDGQSASDRFKENANRERGERQRDRKGK